MPDVVSDSLFHLIGDRSVASHLCKDGSLEFFDGHLFRSLVRVNLDRFFCCGFF